jgi:hypothetical protein
MPAKAGIQGREGMDTGFRRYDGNLVPTRRRIIPAHVFSKEDTKSTKKEMKNVGCAKHTLRSLTVSKGFRMIRRAQNGTNKVLQISTV